jgi:hypothetical protein
MLARKSKILCPSLAQGQFIVLYRAVKINLTVPQIAKRSARFFELFSKALLRILE